MESWRLVWRNGFLPSIPTEALVLLRVALQDDDPRLTQGSTTTPPPLHPVVDWPVEAADAIGFCGAVLNGGFHPDTGAATVGQVEEFFARLCFEADQRLGEPAACRWFINWFDDTPRGEMRRGLLAEVERAFREREGVLEWSHRSPDPSVPPAYFLDGKLPDEVLRFFDGHALTGDHDGFAHTDDRTAAQAAQDWLQDHDYKTIGSECLA